MRQGMTVLVCAMLWCGLGNSQTKPASKPSLKDTLLWMDHFSTEHGFLAVHGQFTRTNKLSGQGCIVHVEVHYPKATMSSRVKTSTAEVNLADIDPKVRMTIDEKNRTYVASFERTDREKSNRELLEYGDGSKADGFAGEEDLYFDTKESAQRFTRALSHAVTLCGGTSPPF
jgi:hypothetical protein